MLKIRDTLDWYPILINCCKNGIKFLSTDLTKKALII